MTGATDGAAGAGAAVAGAAAVAAGVRVEEVESGEAVGL